MQGGTVTSVAGATVKLLFGMCDCTAAYTCVIACVPRHTLHLRGMARALKLGGGHKQTFVTMPSDFLRICY